jgi:23S rRNA (uracil1939-C5)-methyltransferase
VDGWLNLHAMLPSGSTLIHATNNTHSPVANGIIQAQRGPGYLEETTHDVTYRISPFSFFQTNTKQMHRLVELALEGAQLSREDVAWDLYCGTGTLTLPAARHAQYVVGVELVQSSIDDAHANAMRNGIGNVELHALDLHAKQALGVLQTFRKPDVIIIDPPRSGMHPQVAEHVLEVAPKRISHVSCNPATLARDAALLGEKYELRWMRAVDMFPQTSHIEAVAAFELR